MIGYMIYPELSLKKRDISSSSEMEMIVNTQIYRKVFSRIFEVKETSKIDKSIT